MIFALVAITLSTACCLAIRREGVKETRLARTIFIRTPASVIFSLVSRVDRMPEWYRTPARSLRLFARSRLSHWGELIPSEWRLDRRHSRKRIQVIIQPIQDNEFRYQYCDPREVRHELIFRLRPRSNGCLLVWEIRYRMRRWQDILLNRRLTEGEIYRDMALSLDLIRRMAEEVTGPSFRQSEIDKHNHLKPVAGL
jgi:hypothetical protein